MDNLQDQNQKNITTLFPTTESEAESPNTVSESLAGRGGADAEAARKLRNENAESNYYSPHEDSETSSLMRNENAETEGNSPHRDSESNRQSPHEDAETTPPMRHEDAATKDAIDEVSLSEIRRTLEQFTLSISEAVKIMEMEGVPRHERTLIDWCSQSDGDGKMRLLCFQDPRGKKPWFINRESLVVQIRRLLAMEGRVAASPVQLLNIKSGDAERMRNETQKSIGGMRNESVESNRQSPHEDAETPPPMRHEDAESADEDSEETNREVLAETMTRFEKGKWMYEKNPEALRMMVFKLGSIAKSSLRENEVLREDGNLLLETMNRSHELMLEATSRRGEGRRASQIGEEWKDDQDTHFADTERVDEAKVDGE